jgi:nicotinamidase-related amidase
VADARVQDFHPAGHVSFASTHGAEPFKPIQILHPIAHGLLESTTSPAELRVRDAEGAGETIEQMLWPDHCVQGTHVCLRYAYGSRCAR